MALVYLHFENENAARRKDFAALPGFNPVFGRSDLLSCDESAMLERLRRDPSFCGGIRITGMSRGIEYGKENTKAQLAELADYWEVTEIPQARNALAQVNAPWLKRTADGRLLIQRSALPDPEVRDAVRAFWHPEVIRPSALPELPDNVIKNLWLSTACHTELTALPYQAQLCRALFTSFDKTEQAFACWRGLLECPELAGSWLPSAQLLEQLKSESVQTADALGAACDLEFARRLVRPYTREANLATSPDLEPEEAFRHLGSALWCHAAAWLLAVRAVPGGCEVPGTPLGELDDLAERLNDENCALALKPETQRAASMLFSYTAQLEQDASQHTGEDLLEDRLEKLRTLFSREGAVIPFPCPGAWPERKPPEPCVPLYLNSLAEGFKELKEDNPGAFHWDPVNRGWWTADTENGRKAYAAFLPQAQSEPEDEAISDALIDEKSRQILAQHGFSSCCINALSLEKSRQSHDGWVRDKGPHQDHLCYKILCGSSPVLLIKDFHGPAGGAVRVPLIQHSKEEWADLRRRSWRIAEQNRLAALNAKNAVITQLHEHLNDLQPLAEDDAYSKKKQVSLKGCGALGDPEGKFCDVLFKGAFKDPQAARQGCVIPLCNASGGIVSAQLLHPEGKRFLSGAPLKGVFAVMGGFEKLKAAKAALLCEGAATAASVRSLLSPVQDREIAVIAALNCGNLPDVAESIARLRPGLEFGFAADNDLLTASHPQLENYEDAPRAQKNPGVAGAVAGARALERCGIRSEIIMPPLHSSELARKLSDFNDACCGNEESRSLAKQRVQAAAERLLNVGRVHDHYRSLQQELRIRGRNAARRLKQAASAALERRGGGRK